MMTPYGKLNEAGFTVVRSGPENFRVKPRRKLNDTWRAFIRENKAAILASLPNVSFTEPVASSNPRTAKPPKITIPGGVGTELKKQIPKWFESAGCGCSDYAKKLNKKGISWCDKHRDEIVAHLVNKAGETFIGSLSTTLDRIVATRWLTVAIDNARTEESRHFATLLAINPRTKLPDDCVVITAADDRFIAGVTLLAWTTLLAHDCRFRVYDLGIKRGPMRTQLLDWGVEIVKPNPAAFVVPKGVPAWQIWNKPHFIGHALEDHRRVIWLDADTCVGGDLTPLSADGFFVPDHGGHNASDNATRQPIAEFLGPDVTHWNETHYPCVGVIGISREDRHIVAEWIDRTRRVYAADLHQHCQYYDQSVFQTHYTGPLADGSIYNSFGCPRTGDQHDILSHLARYPERVIHHFGGTRKPFLDWQSFQWTHPLANSRI